MDHEAVILVTGARSALGAELLPRLAARGLRVLATSRTPPEPTAEDGHQWVEADPVGEASAFPDRIAEALDGRRVAGVINLLGAWMRSDPRQVLVEATGLLCRTLAGPALPGAAFVFCSGMGVYGHRPGEVLTESSPLRPDTRLGTLLCEAEARLVEACAGGPLTPRVLRFPHLYGMPDDRVLGLMARGRFFVPGDGTNTTLHLHWRDAAEACLRAVLHPQAPAVCIVCDDTRDPLRVWCDRVRARVGQPPLPTLALDEALAGQAALTLGPHMADPAMVRELFAMMTAHQTADTTCMRRELGLQLEVPDWRPALDALLASTETP
jgi:nucleoside-diphosphate-sugar epimerase